MPTMQRAAGQRAAAMDQQGVDDDGRVYQTPQHLWDRAAEGGEDVPQWYTAAGARQAMPRLCDYLQAHVGSLVLFRCRCLALACSCPASSPRSDNLRHAHLPPLLLGSTQSTTGTSRRRLTTGCWAGTATCRAPTCATAAPSCARCGRGRGRWWALPGCWRHSSIRFGGGATLCRASPVPKCFSTGFCRPLARRWPRRRRGGASWWRWTAARAWGA